MTVYILHGWTLDPESETRWQVLINLLKRAGLKVKFLKLPGLLSSLNEAWSLDQYVEWLDGEIKGEKAFLIGHSFGGQVSIRFASRHPEKVERLVLIGNSGIRDRSFLKRLKRGVFLVLAKLGKPFAKINVLRKIFYKFVRETDYLQASPTLRKTMRNVLKDEILDDLGEIDAPTLIIWGEGDRSTPVRHGRLEAKRIKDARLEIIEGAGHTPQFTHPEKVSKLIIKFLK